MRKRPMQNMGGGNNHSMNRNNRMRNKYGSRPQGGGHSHGGGDDELGGRSFKQLAGFRDKYLAMARDALSSGDRVQSEYYLQHADHYFRLMKLSQPEPQPQQHQHQNPNQNPSQNQHHRPRHEGQEGNFEGQMQTQAPMEAENFPEPVSTDEPTSNGGQIRGNNGNGNAVPNRLSSMPAFLREPLPTDNKDQPSESES